jgi:hypothetical protein
MSSVYNNLPLYRNLFNKDLNGREINLYRIENVNPCGLSMYYPNIKFVDNKSIVYNPINERIMSLNSVDSKDSFNSNYTDLVNEITEPVFYFIYNTDNYYHFIYDTLPYLISFFKLKEEIKELKLLMNYPNEYKKSFYNFVKEFLDLLGISDTDIIILDEQTRYREVFISTSYTHDIDSNLPPRKEIYEFYESISDRVNIPVETPKKIYISRRSWIHGDVSNMGTNYTNRRKLINEDDVVDFLTSIGFTEVFTETMTTIEKINLFKNCEVVVGPIGGGLCNVLFSKSDTKLIPIVSPYFLDINERFLFSFSKVKTHLFDSVEHTEKTDFKKFMRVKCGDIIGEISNVDNDNVEIIYNSSPVAGWNSEGSYKKTIVNSSKCFKLDNGLNSMFKLDLDNFKKTITND